MHRGLTLCLVLVLWVGALKLHRDVPHGVNPAARAQAYARVTEVLRAAFDGAAFLLGVRVI